MSQDKVPPSIKELLSLPIEEGLEKLRAALPHMSKEEKRALLDDALSSFKEHTEGLKRDFANIRDTQEEYARLMRKLGVCPGKKSD